ncbi:hypothetical protein I4U23_021532 [Adineta vaga]|nr:hypothetical protein I4U23_021532 [Adineta vaga]
MLRTLFTDLPDLVILNIFHYLSSFDAIQAFYNIDNQTDRILNLLIESQCFSTIHHLRLRLFHFVCQHVLPYLNRKLSHLTLYDHQLDLVRKTQIHINLSSLHLININENETLLSFFLHEQLTNLTIEFLNEHHNEAQAYVCEQFLFNKISKNLVHCHLLNKFGLQLQHLTLFPHHSIQQITIQLKELSDLHILFDHLVNIQILNVKLCQWKLEDYKYDYKKLSQTLPFLIEFSLETNHTLTFNRILLLIEHLIHLEKLSINYRNYDEHGIDINRFQHILIHLNHLINLNLFLKFIYFHLNPKYTFESHLSFKQQWNISTNWNSIQKYYLAYTKPYLYQTYAISTDILFQDELKVLPSITKLSLTTHMKQENSLVMIRLLNQQFPSLTHLHLIDSFGIENNGEFNVKLLKISSFDASDLKNFNLFQNLFQAMPNLIYLYVNCNILINCNLEFLLGNNQIKYLEFKTNNFDEIPNLLIYFPFVEQLTVNNQKQIKQYQRKSYLFLFNWFEISPRLYTIHIKAPKISDLFYLNRIQSDENLFIQHSNEILTLWR